MAREKAPLPNAAPADDKKRAIDTAMAQIERMYGKGAIMRFGDKAELNVDYTRQFRSGLLDIPGQKPPQTGLDEFPHQCCEMYA